MAAPLFAGADIGIRITLNPTFNKLVRGELALANAVLGGGSLPSGLTLSELNDVVTRINENYDEGTNGFLE